MSPEALRSQVVRGLLQRVRPLTKRQRTLLAGGCGLLLFEAGMTLLEPWPLKFAVDGVLARVSAGATVPDAGMWIVVAAAAVLGVATLRALAGFGKTVIFASLGTRMLVRVRQDLYRRLQALSLAFHRKERAGELAARVTSDVTILQDVVVIALLPLLGQALVLLGMSVLLVVLDVRLALLALAPAPLLWLRTIGLSHKIREAARERRHREGVLAASVAESMSAMRVVQALGVESRIADAFVAQTERDFEEDVVVKRLEARLERSVDVILGLATALVLGFGAHLVLIGDLSLGSLIVFLAYLRHAFRPLVDYAKHTGRVGRAIAAGERVLDVLERAPDVRDAPSARPAPPFRGAVAFDGVSFAYEVGREVLRDVSFSVAPGRRVAVVGESGCGKSTLVGLLSRLQDPTRGVVRIDGTDVRDVTLASLRSQVSVVLQETTLFAMSVRDNLAIATPDATAEEVEAAARVANAHEFVAALPEGYETVLAERGASLSEGQRRRLAVARAALQRRPIVVLDEPTAGLDEENRVEVIAAVERLTRGRTTFLVTHALREASWADLVLYVEDGRIVEQGTHPELIALGGHYAALHRLQTSPPGPSEGALRESPSAR